MLSHVQLFVTPWTVSHRLLYPWDFAGKNTGVDCHFLLHLRHWLWLNNVRTICDVSSVQLLSCVQPFATPWTAARQASLFITNSQSWLKLMSIQSVMPSNHLILCCLLLLPPSFFPSIRVFSNESVFHIRWPKYRGFSFSIGPSSEYSGLISFRTDWLDLLAVQGTLKSLSNTTIHKHQFFNAQLILKCSHILGFAYEHDNIF